MRDFSFTIRNTLGVIALLAAAPWESAASAQPRPPLVGTVGSGAMGPPAPVPVPIGGLRTRPLSVAPVDVWRADDASQTADGSALGRRHGVGAGYWRDPYGRVHVRDAGTRVYGISEPAVVQRNSTGAVVRWWPSGDPPRWQVDTSVSRVDAWRDLVVTDVVCNGAGTCQPRQQRVRAPWMAACRCYAFTDGWNRLWRVE